MAWFVEKERELLVQAELEELFPPITSMRNFPKPSSVFQLHFEPEIHDLDEITDSKGGLMQKFLRSFVLSNNYELQSHFLNLLLRSFNQRSEMLKHLDNLHILSDESDIEMFQWAKFQLIGLRHYVEQTEVWVKFWASFPKEKNLNKVQTVLSLLEQFEIALCQDSKIVDGKPVAVNKKKVKMERQRMMFHLNIHSLIVTMLKDGMHSLEEIIDAHSRPGMQEAINILSRVFTKAYGFLTNFVRKNPRNQKALSVHLATFTYHLRINVGQEQLLSALFTDNYDLCMAIKEDLLLEFTNLILSHGRQTRFLLLFSSIQICAGKSIAENQRKVLNILLNNPNKNYFMYLNPENPLEFLF